MYDRTDIDAIKRAHPIVDVVARYGIDLRPSGRALVGRCSFHPDGGRPNLHVYPASNSFYCFRCTEGGDVLRFVQRIESVDFPTAVERLQGRPAILRPGPIQKSHGAPQLRINRRFEWGAEERACLAAATELYQNRLLGDDSALAYVEGRGIDRDTIEGCRLGYAAGGELADYLRWRRLPAQAAFRVGLLRSAGREIFTGRVVIPEVRSGQPVWMVGRALDPSPDEPKYLGLPGRKPFLGWESARDATSVFLVEGPFDWLVLRSWNFPALALGGTQIRAPVLQALSRFERIYLALDNDDAGRSATTAISALLGKRARLLRIEGIKDVADLAMRSDGRAVLDRAVREAETTCPREPYALAA
jgi:DNA primase